MPQGSARQRVSAAVLRDRGREVLTVRHLRRDRTSCWQLPGGGASTDESEETAVLRELREETRLQGTVTRRLFTIPYKYGTSTTFLVDVPGCYEALLGSDPEAEGSDHRKLVEVVWKRTAEVRGNPEIEHLREANVI